MAGASARRTSQSGLIAPGGALVLSVVAVAVAAVGYVLTSHPGRIEATPIASPQHKHPAAEVTPSLSSTSSTSSKPVVVHRKPPALQRGRYSVVVFNNSNVKGLAGRTATRAQAAGWRVVGQDNWYGTISASTVYYPASMQRAAKVLARDLGIGRVMPAVTPMSTDQLTVILTADYAG